MWSCHVNIRRDFTANCCRLAFRERTLNVSNGETHKILAAGLIHNQYILLKYGQQRNNVQASLDPEAAIGSWKVLLG